MSASVDGSLYDMAERLLVAIQLIQQLKFSFGMYLLCLLNNI